VQHLLHKSQFDAVLGTRSHLSSVARTEHFFVHRLEITDAHAAVFHGLGVFVGVMSPKRFAKRAVTRNLIKRGSKHLLPKINLKAPARMHSNAWFGLN
jgi:ribonuclease P protein component